MTTTTLAGRTAQVQRTSEQPMDRPALSPSAAQVPGTTPPRRSLRSDAARWGWMLAGGLIGLATLGWVLWGGPAPLLGTGALERPLTCWSSPLVVAAALAIWGCFAKASHHRKSQRRA